MSKSLLPPRECTEADAIVKDYLDGKAGEMWRGLGYGSRKSLVSAMSNTYGVKVSKQPTEYIPIEEQEPEVINLPPIKLREYKAKGRKRGDEEEAILHASDGHGGKITVSYDEDIYNQRMDTLFDASMAIVTLHRNMYPIRRLHIFNTGDNTQGENPFQGSNVGSVKMGARDQTIKVAYPAWVKLISSLKQEFEEISFEGVPGNHGYEKGAPETSREDLRLYDLLKVHFDNVKGVTVNVHEGFCTLVDVMGFKNFLFHGDGIPCQQGVPFFALDRKLKSWHMQYGGFRYAWSGHFHKAQTNEISSVLEHFMCASLVSDDEWALKKLGISSSPSQGIYGIHPRMGVTWRYKLVVDRDSLAKKLPSLYKVEV